MCVEGNCGAHLAAEEFIERHVGALGEDVPECAIHSTEGVVEGDAAAEVGGHIGGLPDVFDVFGVFADQEGFEILLDGGSDSEWTLAVGGAADAIQAGLAGEHFDDDEVIAAGLGENHFDISDLEGSKTTGLLRYCLLGSGAERSGGGHESESMTPVHGWSVSLLAGGLV